MALGVEVLVRSLLGAFEGASLQAAFCQNGFILLSSLPRKQAMGNILAPRNSTDNYCFSVEYQNHVMDSGYLLGWWIGCLHLST